MTAPPAAPCARCGAAPAATVCRCPSKCPAALAVCSCRATLDAARAWRRNGNVCPACFTRGCTAALICCPPRPRV